MALIKCPECGGELSDLAPVCIHCGYPIAEEKQILDEQERSEFSGPKKTVSRKKLIAILCTVAALLIVYFGFFHLGTKDKYAYDLIIANAHDFKSPKAIHVISGTSGWDDDTEESYAFLCVTALNSYGAETVGYYCFHPDSVNDVTYSDSLVELCKWDKLNVGSINRRLFVYWFFH